MSASLPNLGGARPSKMQESGQEFKSVLVPSTVLQEPGRDPLFILELLLAILGGCSSYLSLPKQSTQALHGTLYRFGSDGSFYYFFLSLATQGVLLLVRKYRVRIHDKYLFIIPRGVTHTGVVLSGCLLLYTSLHGFVMLLFTFYALLITSYVVPSSNYLEHTVWRFYFTATTPVKSLAQARHSLSPHISLGVFLLVYCFVLFSAVVYTDHIVTQDVVGAKINTLVS